MLLALTAPIARLMQRSTELSREIFQGNPHSILSLNSFVSLSVAWRSDEIATKIKCLLHFICNADINEKCIRNRFDGFSQSVECRRGC